MPYKGSQPRTRPEALPKPASGTLFLVGVPIGHPDDITIRALDVLRSVSIIASESPSATQSLLAYHKIDAPVTSYGPRHVQEKVALLLHRLHQGQDVALVSDCGMPIILDPGQLLVNGAHALQISVRVIPGPSALTAALAISGFSGDTLTVKGPLANRQRALTTLIIKLKKERQTTILYADARSLPHILKALATGLPTRTLAIATNLTKPDETVLQGSAVHLLERIEPLPKNTDVMIVIEGVPTRTSGKSKRPRRTWTTRPRGGGS